MTFRKTRFYTIGNSTEKPPLPPPPPEREPPEIVPVGAARRWRLAGASAVVAVALVAAGLAWWARGAAAPETAGTVASAPVEETVGVAPGGGGGPEAGAAGRADAAAVAPGVNAHRNGSDSRPAANETGSVPEDSAPDIAPEAVEEALGLDRAGWRRIQEGLVALGLDPGAPDGLVGGGTRRAVRAYQEGAGKAATGFLDASDVAMLQHAALEAVEAERQRAMEATAEAERLAELRRPGRVFRDACDGCPELVVIPEGTFMMGSPASEEDRNDNEGPLRRVAVEPFALGRREVTRSEYAAFVGDGRGSGDGCNLLFGGEWYTNAEMSWRAPGFAQGGGHPVVCVSWRDAQAYVEWLSEETGELYRLPSESEWEYAARAGTTTARYWGGGSDDQCGYANGADETGRRHFSRNRIGCDDGVIWTASAASYGANDFGLFDMLGNVWEWVEDCWHEDYRGAPSDGKAWTVGGDCGRRVLRGGAWSSFPRNLRSAMRSRGTTGHRSRRAGFRVARTLD